MVDRIAFSPQEVMLQTGLSRTTVYKAIKDGTIKSVRLGDRILVPKWFIEELLNGNTSANAANKKQLS